MNNHGRLAELEQVMRELAQLLAANGKLSRYPWIESACDLCLVAKSDTDALVELFQLFRTLHTGPGSLFDLVIDREDFDEAQAINERLEFLRNQAWSLGRGVGQM